MRSPTLRRLPFKAFANCLCFGASTLLYAADAPPPVPAPPLVAPAATDTAHAITLTITPRGANATAVFDQLRREGIQIDELVQRNPRLIVPDEFHGQPVEAKKLVEAIAATGGLKVSWYRDDTRAVLYRPAPDAAIERFLSGLQSTDPAIRLRAVWRAGWLPDVRVILPLIEAASHDDETGRLAERSLNRLGPIAAASVAGEKMLPFAEKMLAHSDNSPKPAINLLGAIGGPKALAILERLLADPTQLGNQAGYPLVCQTVCQALMRCDRQKALALLDPWTHSKVFMGRIATIQSLGEIGGAQARAQLEKLCAEGNDRQTVISALGRAGDASSLPILEKFLADADPKVRNAAIGAMAEAGGELALPRLEKALDNKDLRPIVLQALGKIGGEKSFALLKKALTDPDPMVGGSALGGLGEMGGPAAVALLEAQFGDPGLQTTALLLLGPVGGAQSLPALEKYITNPASKHRNVAVTSVGLIGGDAALPILEKALADPQLQDYAIIALADVGSDKALALLEAQLADPKLPNRMRVLRQLLQRDGEKYLPRLLESITNTDPKTRAASIQMLGALDWPDAQPVLEKAFTDPEPTVRSAVPFALVNAVGVKALPLLEKAAADPDLNVRIVALRALAGLHGVPAPAWLEKLAGDPDKLIRGEVVAALGQSGAEKNLPLLEKQLRDPEVTVRAAALFAVVRIGGEKILPLLELAIADKDYAIRDSALRALTQIGTAPALAIVVKNLENPKRLVRSAAVDALVDLRSADIAGPPLMAHLPKETDPALYENLYQMLKKLYAKDPASLAALEKLPPTLPKSAAHPDDEF